MNLLIQEPAPPSEYGIIPLVGGLIALVDLSDFDYISQFHWYAYRYPMGLSRDELLGD